MIGLIVSALTLAPMVEAVPARAPVAAACAAPPPGVGASFSGFVLQVTGGDTVCVARGPEPKDWVKVRLYDIPAGVARGTLMAAAFADKVDCRILKQDGSGAVAACSLNGASLGQIVRLPDVQSRGAEWR